MTNQQQALPPGLPKPLYNVLRPDEQTVFSIAFGNTLARGGSQSNANTTAREAVATLRLLQNRPVGGIVEKGLRRGSVLHDALIKFDPNQPRVPAGNPDGGQWTDEGGAGDASDEDIVKPEGPLYHVTFTRNVEGIKEKGILQFQTSNWIRAGDRERYGVGGIYAFESIEDATRWAAKMDWAYNKEMGSGKISIVEIAPSDADEWTVDTADPMAQAGAKGRWLVQNKRIAASRVGESVALTNKLVRALVKFDPNQPRVPKGNPDGGQWTDGSYGGAKEEDEKEKGKGSEGAATALLEENIDLGVTLEDLEAQLTEEQLALVEAARAANAAEASTRDQYLQEDGTYTPEREALHEEILAEMYSPEAVAKATPEEGVAPELVLTGGRAGAGKTSSMRSGGIELGDKYIYISADTIQEKLPGYSGDRAGVYNPEGQDIADKAEAFGRKLGVNLVFDATMKTQKTALKRTNVFQEAGYDISGYFTHTAPHVSAMRSLQRFLKPGGRFVPPEVSLNSVTNEATFDALTPMLKTWAIYDNNGTKPKLIAQSE